MSEKWKLLPTEPTAEMGRAGIKAAGYLVDGIDIFEIYTAMIAAAPECPRDDLVAIARKNPIAVAAALGATLPAAATECWPCWSCRRSVSLSERAEADGLCPHCNAELDLESWPPASM
jgi:hypothetical protein